MLGPNGWRRREGSRWRAGPSQKTMIYLNVTYRGTSTSGKPEERQDPLGSIFLWGLFLLVLTLSNCLSQREQAPPPAVVAMVNGQSIKEDLLRSRITMQRFNYDEKNLIDSESAYQLKKKVLDQMVQNQAIIDWGEKHGVLLTVEEKAKGFEKLKQGYADREFEIMLRDKGISYSLWSEVSEENLAVEKVLRKALYEKIRVNQADMMAYYKNHRDAFTVEETVRVRQIVTDSIEKAEQILTRIKNGENFAKLAITHSISPERREGGDLGYIARGTFPKEIEEAAFKLGPGELSPVVLSPYGFHIFKGIDRQPKRTLSLEEVLPRIESALLQKKMIEAYTPWLEGVLSESVIQVREDALREMEL